MPFTENDDLFEALPPGYLAGIGLVQDLPTSRRSEIPASLCPIPAEPTASGLIASLPTRYLLSNRIGSDSARVHLWDGGEG